MVRDFTQVTYVPRGFHPSGNRSDDGRGVFIGIDMPLNLNFFG